MGICLISGEATSELNGLCAECGKRWNDSVSRKVTETCTKLQLTDKIDQLVRECESNSDTLKETVNDLLARVNIIECFNDFHDYLRRKSEKTYQLVVQVLVKVLENHPFPRVVLLHLSDFQNTAQIVQQSSELLRSLLSDYKLELEKELKRALMKKQSAQKLKRKHKFLRVELAVLMVVAIVCFIAALFLYVAESSTMTLISALGVLPVILLLVLKVTRYNSIDLNMKMKPHVSYQIDLLDIPDNYINNLQAQVKRMTELDLANG